MSLKDFMHVEHESAFLHVCNVCWDVGRSIAVIQDQELNWTQMAIDLGWVKERQ